MNRPHCAPGHSQGRTQAHTHVHTHPARLHTAHVSLFVSSARFEVITSPTPKPEPQRNRASFQAGGWAWLRTPNPQAGEPWGSCSHHLAA